MTEVDKSIHDVMKETDAVKAQTQSAQDKIDVAKNLLQAAQQKINGNKIKSNETEKEE